MSANDLIVQESLETMTNVSDSSFYANVLTSADRMVDGLLIDELFIRELLEESPNRFNPSKITRRYVKKFGVQGTRTIGSLVDEGILANKGIKSNQGNTKLYYLGKIAAAMPFSPFLLIERIKNEEEVMKAFKRNIDFGIATSLPYSLRYFHAAALPMGPKTRQAHLCWNIKASRKIGAEFHIGFYEARMKSAESVAKMKKIVDLLAMIETNIVLLDEEHQVVDFMAN